MGYTPNQDERLWALLAYLLGIPAPVVAPLVIYFVKKQESRFVAYHAMQSLLIEAAIFAYFVVLWICTFVLSLAGPLALLTIPFFFIGGLLGLGALVAKIVAAIKANGGEWYSLPVIGPFAGRQVNTGAPL